MEHDGKSINRLDRKRLLDRRARIRREERVLDYEKKLKSSTNTDVGSGMKTRSRKTEDPRLRRHGKKKKA